MYLKKYKFYSVFVLMLILVSIYFYNNFTTKKDVSDFSNVVEVSRKITEKNLPPTPFDIIAHYYEALAVLDWERVENLSTPALRGFIRTTGFKEDWEQVVARNEGLEFVMFLVSSQNLDESKGEAWALGKVHWRSKTGNIKNYNQMILLTKTSKGWRIKEIRSFTSVEVVDDFYQAISEQDWARMENLTTPNYWRKLEKAGIIKALKKERADFLEEVYVFFLVDNFWEGEKSAFVSGDVTWKPLSNEFTESTVSVRLVRRDNMWKIDNIKGHWEINK